MEASILEVGNWKKICDLGSGAFGVVSLWKNNVTEDFIAIKKCKFYQSCKLTLKQKERWKKEVDIMKLIVHPNVVKFKEIDPILKQELLKHNPTKLPLLSMEYCARGNLRHTLLKPENVSGLSEEKVRDILGDISNGLQHLHNLKITHRDIKPDNIVLQHCNDRSSKTIYKIIDLGYAKEIDDSTISFVGTFHYLAPEIFETIRYNNSVDYWSMGIMTFEIICGVLPFLPHLTPAERFSELKKKGPDDICIYLNHSGQIIFSSTIKRDNFISNCLKQYIEEWLRHVLQFDPTLRTQNFPGDVKVFDYILNALKKRIINVFSVHKLEFYSYEVDDSTLIGTLKKWIARDVRMKAEDLILLYGNDKYCSDDSKLLCDILGNQNDIFVINSHSHGLVNYPIDYNIPKLIKDFMNPAAKFDVKMNLPLYAQAVHFTATETKIANYFRRSFHFYFKYLLFRIENMKKKIGIISKCTENLLIKIECYISIRCNACDIDLRDTIEYKDCLIYNQRLLASLERSIARFEETKTKCQAVIKSKRLLVSNWTEIEKCLNLYNVEQWYEQTLKLLDVSERAKKIEVFKQGITEVVSKTLRTKFVFFKNNQLKVYVEAMAKMLQQTEKICSWFNNFQSHIQELSEGFLKCEILYRNILINTTSKLEKEKSPSVSSLNGELLNLPTEYLITENQDIRCKFEAVISQGILAHKKYAETMRNMFPYNCQHKET